MVIKATAKVIDAVIVSSVYISHTCGVLGLRFYFNNTQLMSKLSRYITSVDTCPVGSADIRQRSNDGIPSCCKHVMGWVFFVTWVSDKSVS